MILFNFRFSFFFFYYILFYFKQKLNFLYSKLIVFLLPFIIVIGLVGYIVFKGKKAFRNKEHNNETYNSYNQNVYEESSIDDDSNGEIIDVDYKEVDEQYLEVFLKEIRFVFI